MGKKWGKRSNLLIADTIKNPTDGIGNTEALKHNLSGWYSKRITQEHRMIYRVSGDMLEIISLKTHYGISLIAAHHQFSVAMYS